MILKRPIHVLCTVPIFLALPLQLIAQDGPQQTAHTYSVATGAHQVSVTNTNQPLQPQQVNQPVIPSVVLEEPSYRQLSQLSINRQALIRQRTLMQHLCLESSGSQKSCLTTLSYCGKISAGLLLAIISSYLLLIKTQNIDIGIPESVAYATLVSGLLLSSCGVCEALSIIITAARRNQ